MSVSDGEYACSAALQEILASPKRHNETTFMFRRKTVRKPFNLRIVLILKVNIQEGVYVTVVHVDEREKLHAQCDFYSTRMANAPTDISEKTVGQR